jgi:flagellin
MSNDVVLSAALRNNLLSLQDTQSSINLHQQRLATGKKVNSALDNPQSFFAAQALANRASDLSNLLDSIGQSIQVINAANNGVTALTTLVSQAQAVANSAQSTLAGASTQATVTGSANLGTSKLVGNISGISTGDNLTFIISDPTSTINGNDLQSGGSGDHGTNAGSTNVITIAANDTAADLVNKINDLNTGLSIPVITASLDASNHLTIAAVNGGSLFTKFIAAAATTASNQSTANALGFSGIEQFNPEAVLANSTAGTDVSFTQLATNTLSSKSLYTAANTLALASSSLNTLVNVTNTATFTTLAAANTTFKLSVGGKTSANLFAANPSTQTIQGLIDNINNDSSIKSLVSASFNGTTGQIVLTPLTAAATDVQTQLNNGAGAAIQTFNVFGLQSTSTTAVANIQATEDIRFGAAAGSLASLQTQYNTVLAQIDSLVKDTGYAGTNLLNGNSLQTFFNENRTSSLTTAGTTFSSAGLSLTAANFQSANAISTSITQTQNALTTVRNYGGSLANNLSIIQNRQSFTTDTINTLTTGSSDLVNADQNAEGASLLALQTRLSLGVTSLSLASQAQQAILKLF